jgi:hypothetical protein
MEQPEGPFCQSCGMPMQTEADLGTNADGSKSNDYCHYCFLNGAFTDPAITREEMIAKVAGMMVAMKIMPEEQANELANNSIPQLKRWQK